MGGDFLAFQIHKDPKFFTIPENILVEGIKITKQNKWQFPNLLEPIGLEAKIYPNNRAWAVDEVSLNKLNEIYGDKNIILPGHWYNRIIPQTTNGLFDRGIRLYAGNKKALKISYALWWIKSHVVANEIWQHRLEEIEELKQSDHPNKHLLPEVLKSYHNWKWISLRFNLLNNGNFDLRYYVEAHFTRTYSPFNTIKYYNNYSNFDIDKIFYSDCSHLDLIEQQLNVTINREQLKEYTLTNYNLIERCLGCGVDSKEFDDDAVYYDSIINYAKDIINERPNLFDYYNGKRN